MFIPCTRYLTTFKIPSDPWMFQGLLSCISQTWFWIAQLFYQINRKFIKSPGRKLHLFILQGFVFVLLFIQPRSPQRMLCSYQFIHNQTDGPNINRLTIQLSSSHLFGCLVGKSTTRIIKPLSSLIFNSQPKIDYFS
jgi:hypothetical protein